MLISIIRIKNDTFSQIQIGTMCTSFFYLIPRIHHEEYDLNSIGLTTNNFTTNSKKSLIRKVKV